MNNENNRNNLNRGNGLNNQNPNNSNYSNNQNDLNRRNGSSQYGRIYTNPNNRNNLNNQNNSLQYGRNHTSPNQMQNEHNSLRQLDEMYRRGMKSQRGQKRKKFFVATTLTAAAVTAVVVPIVIFQKKEDNRYEVVIQSDAQDFESYSITISRGTTISNLTTQLNGLAGHTLIGIYKDQECTILYEENEQIVKNTTIYLKFEKERYSISIPTSNLYTVNYSTGVDTENVEWGDSFIFWLNLDESCDPDSVEVYTSESSEPLQADRYGRYRVAFVDKDIDIIVNASISMYEISIPQGVTVTDNDGNTFDNASLIEYGKQVTINYSEDIGHKKLEFKINGIEQINGVTITVTSDIEITYVQEQIGYIVALPETMTGYSIIQTSEHQDLNNLAYGSAYTFKINLDEAYNQSSPIVYVNGVQLTPDNNGIYTISINTQQLYWEDAGNFEINVDQVAINTYRVLATTGEGYTISDLVETVKHGQEFTFKVTLEEGYNMNNPTVTVEGATLSDTISRDGDTITYTVTNVIGVDTNSDLTADAIRISITGLNINTYVITATADSEVYDIAGLPGSMKYNETVEFTLTLKTGYTEGVPSFNDCNATINQIGYDESTNTYTYQITNPTGAVDLVITVPKNKYTVTFVDYNGAELYTTEVEHGSTATYAGNQPTRADTNMYTYTFVGWGVNLTSTQITGDTTLTAQYTETLREYSLSYERGEGCDSISVTDQDGNVLTSSSIVRYGDTLTIICTVAASHQTVSLVDITGLQATATDNVYTVTGNVSFTARGVGENQYTVSLRTGTGYTASFTEDGEDGIVNYGDNISFRIDLLTGYTQSTPVVKANGNILTGSNGIYTISSITEDVFVTVEGVEKNTYRINAPSSEMFTLNSLPNEIKYEQTLTFTLTLNAGYTQSTPKVTLTNADINQTGYDSGTHTYSYTISNPTGSIDLTIADVELNAYIVTLTQGTGYILSFVESSEDGKANYGDEISFKLELLAGYTQSAPVVKANGNALTGSNGIYTISSVEGNVTVTVEGVVINTYTVTFKNENGAVLQSSRVNHGSYAEYNSATPTKQSDNPLAYTWEFVGWGEDLSAEQIIGDTEFTAHYEQVWIEYTISYTQPNGATITVRDNETNDISPATTMHYGDQITIEIAYNALTHSLSGTNITGVTNLSSSDYGEFETSARIYTCTITGNVEINVVMQEIEYDVTLTQGTGYTLSFVESGEDGKANYGDEISFKLELLEGYTQSTPVVKANGNILTGSNGIYTISSVEGNVTVTVEGVVINTYTVTFKNENGTVLQSSQVNHGSYAEYNSATPTKQSDNPLAYTWEFTGWGGNLSQQPITMDIEFTAQYEQAYIEYEITYTEQPNSAITVTNQGGSGGTAPNGVAYYGDKLKIEITADTGYEISDINVTGATDNGDGTYTVTGNVEISYITQAITQIIVYIDNSPQTIAVARGSTIEQAMATLNLDNENTCGFYQDEGLTEPYEVNAGTSNGMTIYTKVATLDKLAFTAIGTTAYSVSAIDTSIEDDVVIPKEYTGKPVTTIAENGFKDCKSITSVTLPYGITKLGKMAFHSCDGLTSIALPTELTSIGEYAFCGCDGLTSIALPTELTSIGDYAFYNSGLTSLYIPASVRYFGFKATSGSITNTLIVDSKNTNYSSRDASDNECNAIIQKSTNTLILGCNNTTIPDGVTSIGDCAFQFCDGLTSIALPTGLISIGKEAFYSCGSLTSINIPDSVTRIGENAFRGCDALTSITFSDTFGWSAEALNDGSIVYLSSADLSNTSTAATYLTDTYPDYTWTKVENAVLLNLSVDGTAKTASVGSSNTLEEAMASLGYTLENTCGYFTDSTFINGYANDAAITEGMTIYTKMATEGLVYGVDENGATYVSADADSVSGDVVVAKEYNGNQVTVIGDFNQNTSIESVTLPYGITHIGADSMYAFNRCSSLQSINIPNTVTSIGGLAFAYTALTSITLPNGITSIGSYAFSYTGLTSVTIPDSVTSIKPAAFLSCSNLTSAEFSDPAGWVLDDGTALKSTDLSNTETAARYLRSKYEAYDWNKS